MKTTLTKPYSYKEYSFTITAHLNYSIERQINGKTLHLITAKNDGIQSFVSQITCESADLEASVTKMQERINTFVDVNDGTAKSEEQTLLETLGFN